ncbi:MAG: hypothetical protein RR054_03695 [Clostridia bacterium]
MNCYKCGKKQATTKVISDYNGSILISYYCRACYEELALKQVEKPNSCTICKNTWEDIEKTLMLCPHCYTNNDFRNNIDNLLCKVQNASIHMGKTVGEVLSTSKEDYLVELTEEYCAVTDNDEAEQLRIQIKSYRERNEMQK